MTAQVITPLTIATTTPADQPLAVFVRVADAQVKVEDAEPYVRAGGTGSGAREDVQQKR
jgi:hypothetical protein